MHQRLNSLSAKDQAYFVHPYGNLKQNRTGNPLVIARGDGVHVIDDTGRRYIEGVSGLWYASLGFSEERLAEAAYRQMKKLPCYHAYGNKAADVSIELADKLTEMAPPHLQHVFFANSGSEVNDTAVKIVRYYNNARGRPQKKKIISRHWGFHGVTVAAASLTGVPRNHWDFDLPMPGILHTDCPGFYRFSQPGETEETFATRLAANLEKMILDEGPDTIAAFIAEPVMGAGGAILPPRTYFDKVQAVLRKYDVLFIADEVICGFGRLGDMFGSDTYKLKPDIMTLAKALSSGYQPISALLMTDDILDVIGSNSDKHGVFGHGFTYSAHPVPAAVALETLKIYEERDMLGHVRSVSPTFWRELEPLRKSPIIGELRGIGLFGAIELVADKKTKAKFAPEVGIGKLIDSKCLEQGLILRPIGDVVAIAPPLVISESEIRQLAQKVIAAVGETEKALRKSGALAA